MKGSTIEPLVTKFCMLISGHVYTRFVSDPGRLTMMTDLRDHNTDLKHFKEVRYAIDVAFQKSLEWVKI